MGCCGVGNMHDNGIGGRPAFGGVNARDGSGIKCVGTQAVNSFGGEGDKTTTAQNFGCTLKGSGRRRGGIDL